jgi:predicted transcriptional regulator
MPDYTIARLLDIEERDVKLYFSLLGSGPKKVGDIASMVKQDYTTTYNSIQRCMRAGLVFRDKKTYRRGGRYYVYEAVEPEDVAKRSLETLEQWKVKVNEELEKRP